MTHQWVYNATLFGCLNLWFRLTFAENVYFFALTVINQLTNCNTTPPPYTHTHTVILLKWFTIKYRISRFYKSLRCIYHAIWVSFFIMSCHYDTRKILHMDTYTHVRQYPTIQRRSYISCCFRVTTRGMLNRISNLKDVN